MTAVAIIRRQQYAATPPCLEDSDGSHNKSGNATKRQHRRGAHIQDGTIRRHPPQQHPMRPTSAFETRKKYLNRLGLFAPQPPSPPVNTRRQRQQHLKDQRREQQQQLEQQQQGHLLRSVLPPSVTSPPSLGSFMTTASSGSSSNNNKSAHLLLVRLNDHDEHLRQLHIPHASFTSSPSLTSSTPSVQFNPNVTIHHIPTRHEYTIEERQRMWTSARELQQLAIKNTIELEMIVRDDGKDDDDDLMAMVDHSPCSCVHPAMIVLSGDDDDNNDDDDDDIWDGFVPLRRSSSFIGSVAPAVVS
eukprot:CAMPEP_0119551168 /NCGR_PEP_ID=MMETSP1352-20130426/4493_1 /TAXON_ID=265584 /ORGANISM="Stauroneis constricta, Strain CCMP1120" /LENGTH=301 /DNA_ID=CAMNT_0007597177 /DNA_START=79 /DNA_END=984 /DNA_ORIENTATION=-